MIIQGKNYPDINEVNNCGNCKHCLQNTCALNVENKTFVRGDTVYLNVCEEYTNAKYGDRDGIYETSDGPVGVFYSE